MKKISRFTATFSFEETEVKAAFIDFLAVKTARGKQHFRQFYPKKAGNKTRFRINFCLLEEIAAAMKSSKKQEEIYFSDDCNHFKPKL